MNSAEFLVLNLALAFYNVGTIWAHELDIFRSWRLLDATDFHRVQQAHWRKLPYWVFVPVGVSLIGSLALVGYHPAGPPVAILWSALGCQIASHTLTAILWGPWQARLSRDPLGPRSPALARILATHWIRTGLISAYGVLLLEYSVRAISATV
jgi:hypothetical protein